MKRYLSLALVAFILVSLCVVPASAANDGLVGHVEDFVEWSVRSTHNTQNAFWRLIFGDDFNRPDGYTAFSDSVRESYGTDTISRSGDDAPWFRHYFLLSGITSAGNGASFSGEPSLYDWVTYPYNSAASTQVVFTFPTTGKVTIPYSAEYQFGFIFRETHHSSLTWEWINSPKISSGTANANTTYNPASCSGKYLNSNPAGSGLATSTAGGNIAMYVDVFPISEIADAPEVTEDTRPGSISGDVFYNAESGGAVFKDCTIVNEGDQTIYNPATGVTTPYDNLSYDYKDKVYNLTLDDGSEVAQVTYGAEGMTIAQGDLIYNYSYYYSGDDTGGGSGGSDDTPGGVLGLLVEAVLKFFENIGKIVASIFTGLIGLLNEALSGIADLISLFGSFGELVSGIFGWLPEDLRRMIGGAIGVVLAFGLLKLALK